jgi:hypothetical protein
MTAYGPRTVCGIDIFPVLESFLDHLKVAVDGTLQDITDNTCIFLDRLGNFLGTGKQRGIFLEENANKHQQRENVKISGAHFSRVS